MTQGKHVHKSRGKKMKNLIRGIARIFLKGVSIRGLGVQPPAAEKI